VIDDFSRECQATVVDTSLLGHRVARELDRIAEMRGLPCMVVSDNGDAWKCRWRPARSARQNGQRAWAVSSAVWFSRTTVET
jgi:hypothetical protein